MPFSETFFSLIGLLLGTIKYSEENWEEDAILVARLKKGEREAFSPLVEKYQEDI